MARDPRVGVRSDAMSNYSNSRHAVAVRTTPANNVGWESYFNISEPDRRHTADTSKRRLSVADVLRPKRRYTYDMKRKPNKLLLGGLATISMISGVFAWRDLGRRSDSQVRGSKKAWRVLLLLNPGNSLAYWVFGRR